jgi:predicted transcriptional regulator of viral defense system
MLAAKKLEHLFKQKQGLVTRNEVISAGINTRELTEGVNSGRIERVQPGVYRMANAQGFDKDWLLQVSYRVPKGVVCLLSAMEYHKLSTFIPHEIHLALPTGSYLPKFDYPKVELHQFKNALYSYGIENHSIGPSEIKVYSVEKTLADLLRFQKRYGLELFLESLKTYWSTKRKSAPKLLEAAKVCGVERSMKTYLQALSL